MREANVAILAVTGTLLLMIGVWVLSSHYEMKTFNKFSKTKATLADAMFANLRVVADD